MAQLLWGGCMSLWSLRVRPEQVPWKWPCRTFLFPFFHQTEVPMRVEGTGQVVANWALRRVVGTQRLGHQQRPWAMLGHACANDMGLTSSLGFSSGCSSKRP